jgi:hypothetical protein
VPVRFTRRCSVSGRRAARSEERRREPSAQPRRAGTGGSRLTRVLRTPGGGRRRRMARRRLARPKAWSSARHSRSPRRAGSRTRVGDPRRNRVAQAAAGDPKIAPRLVAPALQQAGGRPRARQTSSPSERPGGSGDRPLGDPEAVEPTQGSEDRYVGSAVVPRSPPVRVVPRRGSRSPRGRCEPKLAAGVPEPKPEDAFTPTTPKRPWSPAPVTRCGR